MRNTIQRWLGILASLVCVAILVGGVLAGYWYLGPYRNFSDQVFVDIEHGMSSRTIGAVLQRKGVVRSRWAFLAVRVMHPFAKLQAGEYRFVGDETPWQVFTKIQRGEIFYEDFTVPEGSNIFEIANLLRQGDTVNSDAFLIAAADASVVRDLDPQAPNLEGYLFPSTYRITHHTTAKQLCRVMTDEFRKQWEVIAGGGSADVHKSVTLASIVEKESALPDERPLVASVYLNRLKLAMPLQCDPTSIYAALLENRYTGVIHRSDLASNNPYNTYTHSGLPPGPIANPGKSALMAVTHPTASNFLYFVAKPGGSASHHFSATLAEHDKAVREYRTQSHEQ